MLHQPGLQALESLWPICETSRWLTLRALQCCLLAFTACGVSHTCAGALFEQLTATQRYPTLQSLTCTLQKRGRLGTNRMQRASALPHARQACCHVQKTSGPSASKTQARGRHRPGALKGSQAQPAAAAEIQPGDDRSGHDCRRCSHCHLHSRAVFAAPPDTLSAENYPGPALQLSLEDCAQAPPNTSERQYRGAQHGMSATEVAGRACAPAQHEGALRSPQGQTRRACTSVALSMSRTLAPLPALPSAAGPHDGAGRIPRQDTASCAAAYSCETPLLSSTLQPDLHCAEPAALSVACQLQALFHHCELPTAT